MHPETDADRLACLRGLGGSFVLVNSQSVFALYDPESVDETFTDSAVRTVRHVLMMLTSDVRKYVIGRNAQVEVPLVGEFIISQPGIEELGFTQFVMDKA